MKNLLILCRCQRSHNRWLFSPCLWLCRSDLEHTDCGDKRTTYYKWHHWLSPIHDTWNAGRNVKLQLLSNLYWSRFIQKIFMEAFGVQFCIPTTSRCSLPMKFHLGAHLACPLPRDKPNGVAWIFYSVCLSTHENRDSLQATRHKRHNFSRLIVIGKRSKSWSYESHLPHLWNGRSPLIVILWSLQIFVCIFLTHICRCSHNSPDFPWLLSRCILIHLCTCYLQQSPLVWPMCFRPSNGNSLWGQHGHLCHNFQPRDVAEWRKWLGRVIFAMHGRFWWAVIGSSFCAPRSASGVLKKGVNGDVTWFGKPITPQICSARAIANWESQWDAFLHWLLWQPRFPRHPVMTCLV